jgi:dihydroflavonol-4-reductase
MHTVLVTGASSFLGYHVTRRLNDAGIRPRVLELRGSRSDVLDRLTVERCPGFVDDPAAVHAAAAGADAVLHLAFKVSVGGGSALLEEMRRVNVDGTRRLLQAAAAAGVRRAVVVASALGVGVNREPVALNEFAAWSAHAFDLPYAVIRRQAELEALSQATARFAVVSVCPSFTLGPDDPVGAPANKLIKAVISRRLPFTLPVGFGCLDVRDFASGMVLAAERGRSGERYLLSGENVTTETLFGLAAEIAGVRPPRFKPPMPLVRALVSAIELVSAIRRRPAPLTRDVLQIVGRYAWYETAKARYELGWTPRPLRTTLEDTIAWLRDSSRVTAPPVREQGARQ